MIELLVVLGVSVAVAQLRWLRVAQREHYLVGSCAKFALRWWRSSALNALLLVFLILFGVASFVAPPAALGAVAISVLAPIRLSIRGRTSKLTWTRRLRFLACTTGLLWVVPVSLVALIGSLVDAVRVGTVLLLLAPGLVDLALWIVLPLERRIADRYVVQAGKRLGRISPIVVAITGSYGKTTTKGYVSHLLSQRHSVVASPRSFNNSAGLARTVNEFLVPGTEILVAEMGTYGRGEIEQMCRWMRPRISVITAIGPVHFERFKDLSITLAAKAEIAEFADDVVLNIDDAQLRSLVDPLRKKGKRVVTCSTADREADVCLFIDGDEVVVYSRGSVVTRQALSVDQQPTVFTNVACAFGVAGLLGERLGDLMGEIASLPQPPNRLTETTGESGVVILDDTFNSNPAGAALALGLLDAVKNRNGRRVLVTPGMVELGRIQDVENRRFARHASTVCSDIVIVGRTNLRALRSGVAPGTRIILAADREEAVAWVKSNLGDDDAVLYENDLPDHYA